MQLMDTLNEIRRDIDRCYFALCFEMDSGLPLGISTAEYREVAESIGAAFGQMLDIVVTGQQQARNPTVREVLKDFKELILETSVSTFFIMVPANNNAVAVAVGVPNQTKLGYARVAIGKHYQALSDAITEIS